MDSIVEEKYLELLDELIRHVLNWGFNRLATAAEFAQFLLNEDTMSFPRRPVIEHNTFVQIVTIKIFLKFC